MKNKIIFILLFFLTFSKSSFAQKIKIPFIESQESGFFKILEVEKSKTKFTIALVVEFTNLENAPTFFKFDINPKGSSNEIYVVDADTGKEYKILAKTPKTFSIKQENYEVVKLDFEALSQNTKKIHLLQKGMPSDGRSAFHIKIENISLLDYTKNSNQENYNLMLKKMNGNKIVDQTQKFIDSIITLPNIKLHPNGWFYQINKLSNGYYANPNYLKNTTFKKTNWTIRSVLQQYTKTKFAGQDQTIEITPTEQSIFFGRRKHRYYITDEICYLMGESANWKIYIPALTFDNQNNRFIGYNACYNIIDINIEELNKPTK